MNVIKSLAHLPLIALIAASTSAADGPLYDSEQRLLLPKDYSSWVFVGSNLGLEYKSGIAAMTSLEAQRADDRLFHNIYIDPAAYEAFVKTGEFPDPTVLVMENYAAESKDAGGILNEGLYNGDLVRVEAAVKDSHRPTRPDSKENWAYYTFGLENSGQPEPVAIAAPDARCYACHKLHAGRDNVWVRFYPKLRQWFNQ